MNRGWLGIGWSLGALAWVMGQGACENRSGLGKIAPSATGGAVGAAGPGASGGANGTGATTGARGSGGVASPGATGGRDGTGGLSSPSGKDGGVVVGQVDAGPVDTHGAATAGIFHFQDPPGRNLDMLFVVDNSLSMMPFQTKLAQQLPTFMNVLKNLPGGQPNLHVAVISSSLGAGKFASVPGCGIGTPGNQNGAFQHRVDCVGLHPGEKFISSVSGVNNFDGDISAVFSCIALLGDNGCGFEHQFASTMFALQKASNANDPDNAGFLRPEASLAIVVLTNEDDCSTPPDFSSTLFSPAVETLADPSGLGGLQSYRCNAFGHLCNGAPPPHLPPAPGTTVTLTGCTSSEGMSPGPGGSTPNPDHQLIAVKSFVDFLKGLKADPTKISVAALAGPPTPYGVQSQTFPLSGGLSELQPSIAHSCVQNTGEFADPAVRIKNWLDAFGSNAVWESICANDFAPALTTIATAIGKTSGVNCIDGPIARKADGTLDCKVVSFPTSGEDPFPVVLPLCDSTRTAIPCWQIRPDNVCGTGQRLDVCHDTTCAPVAPSITNQNLNVSCSLVP